MARGIEALADFYEMFRVVTSARKGRLSKEQIEWLMYSYERTEYFREVMEWVKKQTSSPDTLQRSGS